MDANGAYTIIAGAAAGLGIGMYASATVYLLTFKDSDPDAPEAPNESEFPATLQAFIGLLLTLPLLFMLGFIQALGIDPVFYGDFAAMISVVGVALPWVARLVVASDPTQTETTTVKPAPIKPLSANRGHGEPVQPRPATTASKVRGAMPATGSDADDESSDDEPSTLTRIN